MALLFQRLAPRLRRVLRPRFTAEAARVTVFVHAIGKRPAADLILKYAGNSDGELYAFIYPPTNVEAVMDVWKDREGRTHWEVARMTAAALDIYFDGELKTTFPERSNIGYVGWKE